MVVLSQEMQRMVLAERLGFVATSGPDGSPNLSPKGTLTIWDEERLFFADLASPGTVANLEKHPKVEMNVVDPILRRGYRFRGTARVYSEGDWYEEGLRKLADRQFESREDRVHGIVVIDVERALPLISPAYQAGRSEADVAAVWIRRFRVRMAELEDRYRLSGP